MHRTNCLPGKRTSPNVVSVITLIQNLFYLVHIYTCLFTILSLLLIEMYVIYNLLFNWVELLAHAVTVKQLAHWKS